VPFFSIVFNDGTWEETQGSYPLACRAGGTKLSGRMVRKPEALNFARCYKELSRSENAFLDTARPGRSWTNLPDLGSELPTRTYWLAMLKRSRFQASSLCSIAKYEAFLYPQSWPRLTPHIEQVRENWARMPPWWGTPSVCLEPQGDEENADGPRLPFWAHDATKGDVPNTSFQKPIPTLTFSGNLDASGLQHREWGPMSSAP